MKKDVGKFELFYDSSKGGVGFRVGSGIVKIYGISALFTERRHIHIVSKSFTLYVNAIPTEWSDNC